MITVHEDLNDCYRGKFDPAEFIVVHYDGANSIERSIEYLSAASKDQKLSLSYNFLIEDDACHQLVRPSWRAWHAGKCSIDNLNKRSIGIAIRNRGWVDSLDDVPVFLRNKMEFRGGKYWERYSTESIHMLKWLVAHLRDKGFAAPGSKVIAHSDVSLSGKVDPGPMFPGGMNVY